MFFNNLVKILSEERILAIACPVRVLPGEEKFKDRWFHFFYNNYVKFLNKYFMGMGRGECHIVRKKVFKNLKGYDEKLFAGEDFDFFKRIRKTGKILYCKNLLVYESPRRYRKFGYSRVFWDWAKNSIWITFFGSSISKVWEEVR